METREAERIALQSLAWMIGKEELVTSFLGQSGQEASDMKAQTQNPEFLGFVLDFILSSDQWVLELQDETNISPQTIWQARQTLPGGEVPNWT